ncbi:hypothetical protein [Flavobacterium piscis]|uniref:Uncharacterized protein n=1 Tax=Flavobacterium piscis TaxID=1114874 RepID=A0ABU1YA73_9FLAO|nr:hypothetical protein [Flavobacterium piscis]MDR7210376.1 hypothetical protein [Flavobacterium piscis]
MWKSKVSFKNIFGGRNKNSAPPPPPPNLSSYVNLNSVSDFAQGFGKMGVQTVIDGFDLISPGFSSTFDKFGGTDYLNLRPTDNQKAGYYTAMALTFLSPAGAEVGAEKLTVKGLRNILKGGKSLLSAGELARMIQCSNYIEKR